jgi:hypothetical protein
MGKREPQTIVKTDERDIASSSGVKGNLPLNQAVGAKTEFSSRATSSRSQSRRSLVAHAPANGLATGGGTGPMLFSGRLKRRCIGGDSVTETALQPS